MSGSVSAEPFFTMSDVRGRDYLPPTTVTADGVAQYLFSRYVGEPNTFTVDFNNSFTDAHAALQNPALQAASLILGLASIQANKCGFSVKQTYTCNGNVVGAPLLLKKILYDTVAGDYIPVVRKIH